MFRSLLLKTFYQISLIKVLFFGVNFSASIEWKIAKERCGKVHRISYESLHGCGQCQLGYHEDANRICVSGNNISIVWQVYQMLLVSGSVFVCSDSLVLFISAQTFWFCLFLPRLTSFVYFCPDFLVMFLSRLSGYVSVQTVWLCFCPDFLVMFISAQTFWLCF